MTHRLLTGVLRFLRWRLARASRTSSAYRAALSRDLCIHLSTGDGVSMRFAVSDRRFVPDESGMPADLSLQFRTSSDALAFLASRDPLARMIDSQTARNIGMTGNPLLLLWFQGRIQQALPLAGFRQRKVRLPGSVVKPIVNSRTRRQVQRQPATDELDASWHSALGAREEIYMYRVAHGKPLVPF